MTPVLLSHNCDVFCVNINETGYRTFNAERDFKSRIIEFNLFPVQKCDSQVAQSETDVPPVPNQAFCFRFYLNHNLKQYEIDKWRAVGIYIKIEMLEELCVEYYCSAVKIQVNDLSYRVWDKLLETAAGFQIWPRQGPFREDSIKFIVAVPQQLCTNILEDKLREGIYYMRNIMQISDSKILVLSRHHTLQLIDKIST